MKKIFLIVFFLIISTNLWGAVGCDLNDPDRDVKRFFPNSTSYKTEYLSISKIGGETLYKSIEEQLGDKFNGVYEKIDVPYTLYTILKEKEIIGYIHGVNQKGKYGGMLVFLIFDTNGIISNFYFQKLTSKNAKELRSESFSKQFIGLGLDDFKQYDVVNHSSSEGCKVALIKNPSEKNEADFYAALRGTKKNLLLMDAFVFHKQK